MLITSVASRILIMPAPDIPRQPMAARPFQEQLDHYGAASVEVLLLGPTGVGKTHAAHQIHRASGRPGKFVTVSGGLLSEGLGMDELMGHRRGAFTDAVADRAGSIADAASGTLFLDDVHQMDMRAQAYMLRLLSEGTYKRTGEDRVRDVACRFVFATTEDPDSLVEAGRMLPDFRYRLPHIVIRIPSLAERREEILTLATAQANASAVKLARGAVTAWTPEAIQAILCAPWTGNVRELLRVVERGVASLSATGGTVGPITPADLGLPDPPAGGAHRLLERGVLRKIVQELIAQGCSQELAGECVGMHRNSVRNLLREPVQEDAEVHNEVHSLAS